MERLEINYIDDYELPFWFVHLCNCSGVWLLVVDGEVLMMASEGGTIPHLRSASVGSITLTDPSFKPTANWFGSCG